MARGTAGFKRFLRGRIAPAGCALLLLASGCNSKTAPTKQNYSAALNAYYAGHDDCLFPGGLKFPYEVSVKVDPRDTSPATAKQMDALLDIGMLTRFEDKDMKVNRYSLTASGGRAAPRFCYGHRVITSIDSVTDPAKVNGFPETQLEYSYSMMDVPLWAKAASIQTVFPQMAQAVRGESHAKARLAQTMAGWQVPE
jgi:hypothetical protein